MTTRINFNQIQDHKYFNPRFDLFLFLVPKKYQDLKAKMNEEFHEKGKILGCVSYIHYPTQSALATGHAEFEVEGTSWTLTVNNEFNTLRTNKSLSHMIHKAQSNGFPFFRYPISVTPKQLKQLRENIEISEGSFICSVGAHRPLAKYGDYSIPFPFYLSPITFSIYLCTAKIFNSKRIQKIEYYGNSNFFLSIAKCAPGLIFESAGIVSICFNIIRLLPLPT